MPTATMISCNDSSVGQPTWLVGQNTWKKKEENLFVVVFRSHLEWALGGSPWMVGKHALILQHYDECLVPLEVNFDSMNIGQNLEPTAGMD